MFSFHKLRSWTLHQISQSFRFLTHWYRVTKHCYIMTSRMVETADCYHAFQTAALSNFDTPRLFLLDLHSCKFILCKWMAQEQTIWNIDIALDQTQLLCTWILTVLVKRHIQLNPNSCHELEHVQSEPCYMSKLSFTSMIEQKYWTRYNTAVWISIPDFPFF